MFVTQDCKSISTATDLDGLQKSLENPEFLKNKVLTFLNEHLFYYEGHLWWVKPTARAVKVGQQFGTKHNRGYRQGRINNKLYLEHRLIWLLHYGEWPNEIDHINGDKSDNRIENLRDLTHKQNMLNQGSRKGTSRHRGIFWSKDHSKWRVKFCIDGKYHHIGLFETEELALEASNRFIRTVKYSKENDE